MRTVQRQHFTKSPTGLHLKQSVFTLSRRRKARCKLFFSESSHQEYTSLRLTCSPYGVNAKTLRMFRQGLQSSRHDSDLRIIQNPTQFGTVDERLRPKADSRVERCTRHRTSYTFLHRLLRPSHSQGLSTVQLFGACISRQRVVSRERGVFLGDQAP